MNFYIISPFEKKTHSVAWLEINTPLGNYVIQPGHVPMILTLSANKELIYCLTSGKQESFIVKQGLIEITRTTATVLLDEQTI